MQTSTLKTIGTVFLLVALAGQAAAASFQLDARARTQIDAEAQRLIGEQITPGLAVSIMSRGKIIYAKGFGLANLETCTEVSPDAVFGIGSLTKQFTAAAIVMLMEQGKLTLEDRLSRFLPDFPRSDEVTIRHLLQHTSGIHSPPHTPVQDAALQTTADVVALIQNQNHPYDFAPGTESGYSNAGYILLAAIIEQLSNGLYGDFLQQNLLDRAETTATAFDSEREIVFNRASGYHREEDTNPLIHAASAPTIASVGAAGMRSTVIDLMRWQDALHGGRIVSAEGVQVMTTRGTLDNGDPLPGGLGGVLGEDNGHAYFSADGGGPGIQSSLKVYPEDDVAFAVLANFSESRVPPGAPDTDAVTSMKAFLSQLIAGGQQELSHASRRPEPGTNGQQRAGFPPDLKCRRAGFDNPGW